MSRARDIANYGDGIDTSSITSGTFADARIAASNVTQHEGSIDALASNPTVTLGSNTTFGSGVSLANATFPAGHIVQIVTGERKLRSTVQSTSPTQTDLQATITPSSTSNKIQVFVTGSWGITGPNLAKFRLYKKVGGSAPASSGRRTCRRGIARSRCGRRGRRGWCARPGARRRGGSFRSRDPWPWWR